MPDSMLALEKEPSPLLRQSVSVSRVSMHPSAQEKIKITIIVVISERSRDGVIDRQVDAAARCNVKTDHPVLHQINRRSAPATKRSITIAIEVAKVRSVPRCVRFSPTSRPSSTKRHRPGSHRDDWDRNPHRLQRDRYHHRHVVCDRKSTGKLIYKEGPPVTISQRRLSPESAVTSMKRITGSSFRRFVSGGSDGKGSMVCGDDEPLPPLHAFSTSRTTAMTVPCSVANIGGDVRLLFVIDMDQV